MFTHHVCNTEYISNRTCTVVTAIVYEQDKPRVVSSKILGLIDGVASGGEYKKVQLRIGIIDVIKTIIHNCYSLFLESIKGVIDTRC